MNEASLLRLDLDEKLGLIEQDFIVLNASLTIPKTNKELPFKINVDSSHENRKSRRDF